MSFDEYGLMDTDDIPWGKYTYSLEGLARECYLEGALNVNLSQRPGAPPGKRLRFRVELPERCFIVSIIIKLPNAPVVALDALDDICIERTIQDTEYEMVHDGVLTAPPSKPNGTKNAAAKGDADADDEQRHARSKEIVISRAADSLRITLADIDPPAVGDHKMRDVDYDSDPDARTAVEIRKLGVVVKGFVRGRTPVKSRIKILLASSTKLMLSGGSLADKAEIDGLLGLAFLANKKFRQAGEFLERASVSTRQVAIVDQKKGFAGEAGFSWAAQLNLLAAYAYLEHDPISNDGTARLIDVVTMTKPRASTAVLDVEPRNEPAQFLDLRTELLQITQPLMFKLVQFLGESPSLAVQMASAGMIEFVGEQLGCAIAPYMGKVLDQVLRAYPECKPISDRDKPAAIAFSCDSMEGCYERLVDFCCRYLPHTEHSVLQRILEQTLMPILHDAFDENLYLLDSDNVEDEADDLLCAAVSQTLRLVYLVLSILGGDAKVPPSFISKLLNMLITEDGRSKTPMLLRRSALHTWDAMTRSVVQASSMSSVKDIKDYVSVQVSYLSRIAIVKKRPPFVHRDGEDSETGYEVREKRFKESTRFSPALKAQLEKINDRIVIDDHHTLRRLLTFMTDMLAALIPMSPGDERHTASTSISRLLKVLNQSMADLVLSTLLDISICTAVISGQGPESNLSFLQYPNFNTHLKVCLETLQYQLDCYWAAMRLLPKKYATDTEKKLIVRSLLSWCVYKMKEAAPPRDMMRLLLVIVQSYQNEASETFKQDFDIGGEITPLDLYRVNNLWLPHSAYFEALELHDNLLPVVAQHLRAKDILVAINGLGDQDGEELVTRAGVSGDLLASIIANTVPANPDETRKSLEEIVDPTVDKSRIVDGFPKANTSSGRSSTSSLRKMRLNAPKTAVDEDQMVGSLYIHIVLASCFDKFDSMSKETAGKCGGLCMSNYVDSFIEHARFLVKAMKQCAKRCKHREYIGHSLGDILDTCLEMQNNGDGRVRLAGFEIFAAALDVLFLTDNAVDQEPSISNHIGLGTLERTGSTSFNGPSASSFGSIREISSSVESIDLTSPNGNGAPNGPVTNNNADETVNNNNNNQPSEDEDGIDEIYTNGGTCTFYASSSSSSDLSFEERGWLMLCTFMSSSLGIGKYADFVVHRACLQYLRGCMLSALRGKSTGASVISFYHVESIWEAVLRIIGSPVHSLNGLALWVICATINVGVYSAVMAKGRGESRQRAGGLEEFVTSKLFITAENFMKGRSKEMRLWGGRLLEVYVRARNMNPNSQEICPPPSRKVLLALQSLEHDWNEDSRTLAKSVLAMHREQPAKKVATPSSSFQDRAASFLNKGRFGAAAENEESDGFTNTAKIDLWFPALPVSTSASKIQRFGKTLEAFANTEVLGGEEIDPDDEPEEHIGSEYDDDDSEQYEDDDIGEYSRMENFGRTQSLEDGIDAGDDGTIVEPAEESSSSEEEIDEEEEKGKVLLEVPKEKEEIVLSSPEGQKNNNNTPPSKSVIQEEQEEEFEPMETEKLEVPEPISPAKKKHVEDVFMNKPSSPEIIPAQNKEGEKSPKIEKSKSEKKSKKDGKNNSNNSPGVVVSADADNFPDTMEGMDTDLDFDDMDFDGLGAIVVEETEEVEMASDDPDLERMPSSLPRIGSFSGRKTQVVNAEGEGIRLGRRSDVVNMWEANLRRDEEERSRTERRGGRGSSNSLGADDFSSMRDSNNNNIGGSGRRSMDSSSSTSHHKGSRRTSPKEPTSAGLLHLSSTRKVQRGVKLDDEEGDDGDNNNNSYRNSNNISGASSASAAAMSIEERRRMFEAPTGSGSFSRRQDISNKRESKSSKQRALPRVPAFTKAGSRRSGTSGSSSSDNNDGTAAPNNNSNSVHRFSRTRSSSSRSKDRDRDRDSGEDGPSSQGRETRRRGRRINSNNSNIGE